MHVPIINQESTNALWITLRDHSRQRELIPRDFSGHFTATHFKASKASSLNAAVHLHKLRFQVLYVRCGSITIAYESQGTPTTLRAGDFALQPPKQCHAVIDSSADLELIEFFGPKNHEIIAAPDTTLPSITIDRGRLFDGQHFATSMAKHAEWHDWQSPLWSFRSADFVQPSTHLAEAQVLAAKGQEKIATTTAPNQFSFFFILKGRLDLLLGDRPTSPYELKDEDSFLLPPATSFELHPATDGTELLLMTTPTLA
ncbi:MAG: mannose-6-phosphate isomerase-like protein (cupin superfamily) [Planctomycetota bacterium]|jgi:mannose-6-phosphate isomerase-like protein (cupin superfamily)